MEKPGTTLLFFVRCIVEIEQSNVAQTDLGDKPMLGVQQIRSIFRSSAHISFVVDTTLSVRLMLRLLPWCKSMFTIAQYEKSLFLRTRQIVGRNQVHLMGKI